MPSGSTVQQRGGKEAVANLANLTLSHLGVGLKDLIKLIQNLPDLQLLHLDNVDRFSQIDVHQRESRPFL
jgi:hypothetical protein